jgi:hypothetical protein
VRVVASRAHETGAGTYYWYAFHSYYKDPLDEYPNNRIAFGCGGPEKVLMFDLKEFIKWVPKMNSSTGDNRIYHHVHFLEGADGKFALKLRGGQAIDVTMFLLR